MYKLFLSNLNNKAKVSVSEQAPEVYLHKLIKAGHTNIRAYDNFGSKWGAISDALDMLRYEDYGIDTTDAIKKCKNYIKLHTPKPVLCKCCKQVIK